jgi:F-type H+-transporting ATPase subunit gamma
MRLRIRSVKNIAQVTRALETVSASKVRRAIQAEEGTRPYAEQAWKLLVHLARQPGHSSLHPLLVERPDAKCALVVMVSSDRGLAGAYNVNIVRHTLQQFRGTDCPMRYITVGRKGRDMLHRRGQNIIAEFSHLPDPPSYLDVSSIGRLVIDEYMSGEVDQVFLAFTDFKNMVTQMPTIKKILPVDVEEGDGEVGDPSDRSNGSSRVFTYEPDESEILDQIVRRSTAVQVYQAVLTSLASEHAARMVAMRNATDNAVELTGILQLEYNKARQQTITNDMIDITGGAEALAKSSHI